MNINLLRVFLILNRNKSFWEMLSPRKGRRAFKKHSSKVLDDFFFDAIKSLGVKGFMECGAHEAEASTRFSYIGNKAVAFEANPITYQNKTVKASSEKVITVNMGLSDTKGSIDFFVPKSNATAGNSTFQPKKDESYDVNKIPVDTIDFFYKENFSEGQKVALWIDVEGFAEKVLKGAESLLESESCLILKVELETYPHFEGQWLSSEVSEYLENKGFIPVLCDFEGEDQFNAIFMKKQYVDNVSKTLVESYDSLSSFRLSLPHLIKLCL